jgi:hypothetical protein
MLWNARYFCFEAHSTGSVWQPDRKDMGMSAEALVELQKVFKAAEENEGGLLDQVCATPDLGPKRRKWTANLETCQFLHMIPLCAKKKSKTSMWRLSCGFAGNLPENMHDHQNPLSINEVLDYNSMNLWPW